MILDPPSWGSFFINNFGLLIITMPSTNNPVTQSRWDKKIAYINSRRDVPCHDCGGTFPLVCMDFHHIDEETKYKPGRSSMKNTMKQWGRKKIDEELDKCVVLCACCHRIRHF